jgi:hypothetical protein
MTTHSSLPDRGGEFSRHITSEEMSFSYLWKHRRWQLMFVILGLCIIAACGVVLYRRIWNKPQLPPLEVKGKTWVVQVGDEYTVSLEKVMFFSGDKVMLVLVAKTNKSDVLLPSIYRITCTGVLDYLFWDALEQRPFVDRVFKVHGKSDVWGRFHEDQEAMMYAAGLLKQYATSDIPLAGETMLTAQKKPRRLPPGRRAYYAVCLYFDDALENQWDSLRLGGMKAVKMTLTISGFGNQDIICELAPGDMEIAPRPGW